VCFETGKLLLKGAVSRYFCCFLVKTLQIQFPIAFTCGQHTSLSTRTRSAINFYGKIYLRYSGPKTRSFQTENLKICKSCNPSPPLPSVTMGDSKESQGCNIVSRKQTE